MLRQSPAFEAFFSRATLSADNNEQWPLAMLPQLDAAALGVERGVVTLSRTTLFDHLAKHPEITLEDYRRAQTIIDAGEVYADGAGRLAYFAPYGETQSYFLAIKRDAEGASRFLMTLFRMNERNAAAKRVKLGERIR